MGGGGGGGGINFFVKLKTSRMFPSRKLEGLKNVRSQRVNMGD